MTTSLSNEYGPDKPCKRSACTGTPAHLGGAHIDARSPLYDGPDITVNALGHSPRQAARNLLAADASVPDVIDLVEEIHRLKCQVAAVMVDKDRAVRSALAHALDCEEHGKDLRSTEEQAQFFAKQAEQNDRARLSLVGGMHQLNELVTVLQQRIRIGDELPDPKAITEALAKTLKRMGDAHDRAWKK